VKATTMLLIKYIVSLLSLKNVLGQINNVGENLQVVDDGIPHHQHGRNLFGEICPANETLVEHYFEVIISIQPDSSITAICTLGDQMKMGYDINSLLSSHVSSYLKLENDTRFFVNSVVHDFIFNALLISFPPSLYRRLVLVGTM
jgi:hypothetical protein